VEFVDVLADAAGLERMLSYSGGNGKIPVIVDRGSIIIGFNGRG